MQHERLRCCTVSLHVACCMLHCCTVSLHVACCMLHCCTVSLQAACCMLHCCTVSLQVACCMLHATCCIVPCRSASFTSSLSSANPPAPMHARTHAHVSTHAHNAHSRFHHRLSHVCRTRIARVSGAAWSPHGAVPRAARRADTAAQLGAHMHMRDARGMAAHRDISGSTRRRVAGMKRFFTPQRTTLSRRG